MLKKIFNRKKKNEPADYEKLSISSLEKGCMLDYFMETWQVKGCYDYDWGNNFFTKEYLLDNGREKIYLHVEENGDLTLSISRSINVTQLKGNIKQEIIDKDDAPSNVVFNDTIYKQTDSSQGYFREAGSEDWSEFVNWEFQDEKGENFISVMRWGETDIEASVGEYVKAFEFTNLLPANN